MSPGETMNKARNESAPGERSGLRNACETRSTRAIFVCAKRQAPTNAEDKKRQRVRRRAGIWTGQLPVQRLLDLSAVTNMTEEPDEACQPAGARDHQNLFTKRSKSDSCEMLLQTRDLPFNQLGDAVLDKVDVPYLDMSRSATSSAGICLTVSKWKTWVVDYHVCPGFSQMPHAIAERSILSRCGQRSTFIGTWHRHHFTFLAFVVLQWRQF